jgi:putative insertion element HTH domain-containing protein
MSQMSENVRLFRLSARRVKAAQLVAEDALTDEQIAAKVGITDRQLRRWKRQPAFSELVTEIAERLAAEIRGKGLVELSNRVDALNSRWARMQAVIEERAADPTMTAPGSSTGLLTRTQKQIGSGDSAVTVEEYQVDTGLLKELREHEKQAAQELGQWSKKARVEQGPIEVQVVWSDQDAHP